MSRREVAPPDEYIEATPASRRKLVAVFVVAVVAGLVILEYLLPEYLAYIRTLPFCEQVDWVESTFLALMLGLVVLVPWIAKSARDVLRLEQWPLPGSWVWSRTRVERGARVRWRGRGMVAAAVVLLVVPLVSAYSVHGFLAYSRERCSAVEAGPR
jgi:hypothetical protein